MAAASALSSLCPLSFFFPHPSAASLSSVKCSFAAPWAWWCSRGEAGCGYRQGGCGIHTLRLRARRPAQLSAGPPGRLHSGSCHVGGACGSPAGCSLGTPGPCRQLQQANTKRGQEQRLLETQPRVQTQGNRPQQQQGKTPGLRAGRHQQGLGVRSPACTTCWWPRGPLGNRTAGTRHPVCCCAPTHRGRRPLALPRPKHSPPSKQTAGQPNYNHSPTSTTNQR